AGGKGRACSRGRQHARVIAGPSAKPGILAGNGFALQLRRAVKNPLQGFSGAERIRGEFRGQPTRPLPTLSTWEDSAMTASWYRSLSSLCPSNRSTGRSSWLRLLTQRWISTARPARRRSPRIRPALEFLEDRITPTTLNVTAGVSGGVLTITGDNTANHV